LTSRRVNFRSPFLAGAVVGSHDEDRVVEPADLGEEIDQPADLRVGVVEEIGEGRLKLDGELLLLGAEAVPRFDPWVAGRQHRVRRDDALIGQEKAPLDESGRL